MEKPPNQFAAGDQARNVPPQHVAPIPYASIAPFPQQMQPPAAPPGFATGYKVGLGFFGAVGTVMLIIFAGVFLFFTMLIASCAYLMHRAAMIVPAQPSPQYPSQHP